MKGTLAEGFPPGVVREIYVGRKSGLLHFSQGDARRSVRFHRGQVINAVSTVREDRMGETLVRLGALSQADLDRATALIVSGGRRLGQILIDLGAMDQARLEDALALHVRETLLKAFGWREGTYEFEELSEESIPTDVDVTLKLSTGEMILETVRRVQDADAVRRALGDLDRVPVLSSDPLLRFQKVALTPADGYILSRVDGVITIREIIQLIPMVPEDVERSILGLLSTGIVELDPTRGRSRESPPRRPAERTWAPAPAAAPVHAPAPPPTITDPSREAEKREAEKREAQKREAEKDEAEKREAERKESEARRQEVLEAFQDLKTKNHFEILGIPKASNEAQVKEAYFRLAKRFHPDAHHDRSLTDLRDKLEAVFIRLGQAYEVLRNPTHRSSYESDLAARTPRVRPAPTVPGPLPAVDPEAEARAAMEDLHRAEKLFEEEKYWDVIQLLEPRLPHMERKGLSRARLLLGRAYGKNPKWTRQAEKMLKEASEADPSAVDPYLALARLYQQQTLKSRATSMYRKVLELRPDHEEARRELASLDPESPPPTPPRGSLLKKLFGRS